MTFTPRTLADGRICCSAEYALCDACAAAFKEDDYAPPNPYEPRTLRTAEEMQAERLRDLMQEHFDICMEAAAMPAPRLTAAELAPYEPPNGYALKETR